MYTSVFVATHTKIVTHMTYVVPRLGIDVTVYYDVMFPDTGAKSQEPRIASHWAFHVVCATA